MSKISEAISGSRNFVGEVKAELKKCAWPTQSELMQSTGVVIVSVILLAVLVGVSDVILMWLMRMIIR